VGCHPNLKAVCPEKVVDHRKNCDRIAHQRGTLDQRRRPFEYLPQVCRQPGGEVPRMSMPGQPLDVGQPNHLVLTDQSIVPADLRAGLRCGLERRSAFRLDSGRWRQSITTPPPTAVRAKKSGACERIRLASGQNNQNGWLGGEPDHIRAGVDLDAAGVAARTARPL
jgi:hypothetical protein